MGTICILLGLILFIGFTGGGFFIANKVAVLFANTPLYMSFFGLSSTTPIYVGVVGLCALVGLLICLGLVMNGLIYNRLNKMSAVLKRHRHH